MKPFVPIAFATHPAKDEVLILGDGVGGCTGSDRARREGRAMAFRLVTVAEVHMNKLSRSKAHRRRLKRVDPCISTNVTPKAAIPSGGSVAHAAFEFPDAQKSDAAPGSTSSQTYFWIK